MRRNKILTAVAGILLAVAVLLTAVDVVALHDGFYAKQHQKLGTAAYMGMDDQDLADMTKALLDYIKGDRPDIDVQVSVYGQQRAAYDQREIDHMVDVMKLYQSAMTVRLVLLVLAALLAAGALALGKMKLSQFAKWLMAGFGLGTLLIAGIGGLAATNFDWFWTTFHEVLFSNDLWLLDPATSLMINLLPSELFFSLCMTIILVYAASMALLCGLCTVAIAVGKRREVKGVDTHA